MYGVIVALVFSLLISCSQDRPAPVAPAAKVADEGLSSFFERLAAVGDSLAREDSIAAAISSFPSYITFDFDGSLTAREQELFAQAVADWENVIGLGHPDGIKITASTDVKMQIPWQLGFASHRQTLLFENRLFPTECFIGLSSPTRWRTNLTQEYKDTQFKKVILHEIGHCLGLGAGSEWMQRVEYEIGWYESGEYTVVESSNGIERRKYLMVQGEIQPSFTGAHAQEAFLQLTEGQWGDHPFVPLSWSANNGADPAHLDRPILMRGVMANGADYGNIPFQQISSIEVAMLKDLGYTVLDIGEDIGLIAGFRSIYANRKTIGVETLFFPEYPLDFGGLEANSSEGYRYNKGYRLSIRYQGAAWGRSTIQVENILYWKDETYKELEEGAAKPVIGSKDVNWCGVE